MGGFCPLELCLLSRPVTESRLTQDLEKKGVRNANSGQRQQQREKFKHKLNTLLSSKQKGSANLEFLLVTLKRESAIQSQMGIILRKRALYATKIINNLWHFYFLVENILKFSQNYYNGLLRAKELSTKWLVNEVNTPDKLLDWTEAKDQLESNWVQGKLTKCAKNSIIWSLPENSWGMECFS